VSNEQGLGGSQAGAISGMIGQAGHLASRVVLPVLAALCWTLGARQSRNQADGPLLGPVSVS
jgi:hypothetical protein